MRAVRMVRKRGLLPLVNNPEEDDNLNPLKNPIFREDDTEDGTQSRSDPMASGLTDRAEVNQTVAAVPKSGREGIGFVQVRMQNMSVVEGDVGATKLIYTVHLGGKAVPAETAAKDMTLLSAQEVALVLGTPVLIQSERGFF